MVSRNALLAAGAAVVGFIFLSGSSGGSDGGRNTGGNGGNDASGVVGGVVSDVVNMTPVPDATTNADPVVNPVNTVTDGAVYQGPDPLDLAPGDEEGQGDLIAPFNPGNAVMGGPVYTGPDPFNLGGNN